MFMAEVSYVTITDKEQAWGSQLDQWRKDWGALSLEPYQMLSKLPRPEEQYVDNIHMYHIEGYIGWSELILTESSL